MANKKATIRDVAEKAGVSLMVVSRVCNPRPKQYVSEAARARVLEAIEALGYRPDERARSLRTKQSGTIGFYSGFGIWLDDDFARSIFNGCQSCCEIHEKDILMLRPMDNLSPAEVMRALEHATIDGIVYHPPEGDQELATELRGFHKPGVRIGEAFPGLISVVAEDRSGAERMARYLYEIGHRSVIFRADSLVRVSTARRREAFCRTAEELGMTVRITYALDRADHVTPQEEELIREHRAHGVTAVVCWRDWSAAQALLFCRNQGIAVPGDLAIAGFDGLAPRILPAGTEITTIVIDWERIAFLAVQRLIEMLAKEDIPEETIVPCPLRIGNTT